MTGAFNTGLLPLALFLGDAPFDIDLVYADPSHPDNQFPGLYDRAAKMFAHARLVPVLLRAARLANMRHGWRLKFNDCFRPVEAQARMAQYGFPPELVMPPGMGAHPRGMAVDIEPQNGDGDLIPMGTAFDFFAPDLSCNPASRGWTDFGPPAMSAIIIANREKLDACIMDAATACGETVIGFPYEWWDYRFPAEIADQYPALSESALPTCYCMTQTPAAPDADTLSAWQQAHLKILDQIGN